MRSLPLRFRLAALTAALVLFVASLVGLVGYLTLRSSLLSRATNQASAEVAQLAGFVDVHRGSSGQQVDLMPPPP